MVYFGGPEVKLGRTEITYKSQKLNQSVQATAVNHLLILFAAECYNLIGKKI